MNISGIKIKPIKTYNGYVSQKIVWDEDIKLYGIQILDSRRGYFKLNKSQLDMILQIEEHITNLVKQEELFTSSIVINRKWGKVFKCPSLLKNIGDHIGRYCDCVLKVTRVKIIHNQCVKLCWECVDIQNHIGECMIQNISDEELEPEYDSDPLPDPSVIDSLKNDLVELMLARKISLQKDIEFIQDKLGVIDMLQDKLAVANGINSLETISSIEEELNTL